MALSTVITGLCDCCTKLKQVRLYVLQNGQTAWICQDCRTGKKEKDNVEH